MVQTCILGGGIAGASVAYHLAQRGASSLVIDCEAAPASVASGKAAGFITASWGDGKVTERLHRASFTMHERLADTLGLKSYRRLRALRVGDDDGECDGVPKWLGAGMSAKVLDEDAAQVDPGELTHALLREAQSSGLCTLRLGDAVVGIDCADDGDGDATATGVRLSSGALVPCDNVVVALGPWSGLVETWLDVPLPLEGVWSTSLLFDAPDDAESQRQLAAEPAALFCAADARGCHLEGDPRPGGELYVAGCGGSRIVSAGELRAGAVPPSATHRPDATRARAAERSLGALSPLWAGRPADATRACMRPCAPDGLPIVGRLPRHRNVFAATGGNVWGICWAPAIGQAMAELLLDGEPSVVNLKPFAPRRFDTLTHRTLLKQRGRETASGERVGEQW